jgi:hypothetical protein
MYLRNVGYISHTPTTQGPNSTLRINLSLFVLFQQLKTICNIIQMYDVSGLYIFTIADIHLQCGETALR